MLKVVSKQESARRSILFRKGYWDALSRIKGIFTEEKSIEEMKGLIFVFRWVTSTLEKKVEKSCQKTFQIVK